jgi:hypothetical protein
MKILPLVGLLSALVAACGSSTRSIVSDDALVDASGDGTAWDGATRCDSTPCAPGQYCFHPWSCAGACSDTCACYCATLPDACPADRPCSSVCGYFGNPGETFSSASDGGTPFPDGQVHCYGS